MTKQNRPSRRRQDLLREEAPVTDRSKVSKAARVKDMAAEAERVADSKIKRIETSRGIIATIPGVAVRELNVLLIGTAPLWVHNFDQKMIQKILDTHTGEASGGREKKKPIENFQAARYRLPDGSDGIPAGGLKACIVDGFIKGSGVPMTKAKGAIHIIADGNDVNSDKPLVRILHPKEPDDIAAMEHVIGDWKWRIPGCRQDVVRNDSGVVDIRHRAAFWPWGFFLRLEFMISVMSDRQLLQAVATSGRMVGLCEWRPASKESKSGSMGTFGIASPAQIDAFAKDQLWSDHKWNPPSHILRVAAAEIVAHDNVKRSRRKA